ncbi:phospho-N-acetylmuramoyl-pentapeptide-transferase [Aerococcaceae bacterium DSM 111176]|nr:phospho-N-acetylmuramoyl-pentapeptide-transferase [Aerococcaceae bacterium DSM 111176]
MQSIVTLTTSFLLTLICTPLFIQYFRRKKLGQTTREDGPLWHEAKTGTPTMGGTVFTLAAMVTILFLGLIFNQLNGFTVSIVLTLGVFGGIGFVDDFISIFKQQNEGLTSSQKFIAQVVSSFLIIILGGALGIDWTANIFGFQLQNTILIALFASFWMVGFSNATNLTDGLDGLATGLSIIAYGTYAWIAYQEANHAVLFSCLAVIGGLVAFLFYNKKPAKIFMGDVGSLALGAGLAIISFMLDRPLSLLVIGSVFVIETASVILQVASFKTRGKRIFKMSPIHHHFEMSGWSESRVVYTFWAFGLASSVLYLLLT